MDYLSTVSRKNLYKHIRDSDFSVRMYRAIYCGGPGQDVLKRVKRMPVKPGVKAFFFKLHSGTLSGRTYLEEKGIFVPWGTIGYTCITPETIDHVSCIVGRESSFGMSFKETIRKDFALDQYGIRFLAIDNDEGVPFDLIMLMGLHSLRRSRTARLHNDANARPARMYFRESVKAYVEALYANGLQELKR